MGFKANDAETAFEKLSLVCVASLSYGRGDKGAVVKCHAGTNCTTKRICESIGLTMRDLFDDMPERNVGSSAPKPTNAPLGDPTTAYVYYDEGGTPLYRVLRYNPKTFRQQKYTNGTWEWGMEGAVYDMWDEDRHVVDEIPQIIQWISVGMD